ncbi:hypothetical protein [Altererythrobacter sp. GH1-8]|uniref:hypothetical protein n=1 Tax=Altererythrobacter sp. GH1-8 TaxID=3349333 RepID=UPI00374D6B1A
MQRPVIYVLIALAFLAIQPHVSLSRHYFVTHDAFVLLVFAAVWLGSMYWTPRAALPQAAPSVRLVLPVAAGLCLALWAGTHWWMFDYPLTRDEHMVVFDAATYAKGKLAEPLPEEWAGYAKALVPAFLLDTPGSALLVSGYLPINAAMRGFFGLIVDPALMNPLQVAIGFVSLWWIAQRVFPEDAPAQWLTLGGYLLSAQVLVTGMTTYAMTGHLALNLLWLALFLKDRWWSHLLAMLVGVLAMGLHQFVFHPMFAAPFVLWLLLQRRWLHVAAYGAVYLAGIGLWLSWHGIVIDWAGVTPEPGKEGDIGSTLVERVLPLITRIEPLTIQLMAYNLTRGIGWNALFVLPFLLAAGPAFKRRDPIALALLGGLALTLIAVSIILPYQGHGWGYRYIHGVLGSVFLLAAFGYREIAARDRAWANGAAVLLCAVTVLITLTANLWSARSFTEPYVALTEIVDAQTTDFVIVDDLVHRNVVDQVRNRADLSNRPLILSRRWMTNEQLEEVCLRGSVTVIGAVQVEQAGMQLAPSEEYKPLPENVCQTAAEAASSQS